MSTIVLWVSDLERSAAFYADLFSAPTPYISEGFASVSGSGNTVLLHLLPQEYRAEPSYGEDNPIKPVFAIDQIDRAGTVAAKHGCEFKAEAFEHDGKTYLDGKDPDGHVIQVATK